MFSLPTEATSQLLVLETGEQVRCFNEEQLRRLALELNDRDRLEEEVAEMESFISEMQNRVSQHQTSVMRMEYEIEYLSRLSEQQSRVIEAYQSQERRKFCESVTCKLLIGAAITLAVGRTVIRVLEVSR